ncbi:MAG: hypothetical protein WCH98_23240 [Verrucomicrobiota bacterium]
MKRTLSEALYGVGLPPVAAAFVAAGNPANIGPEATSPRTETGLVSPSAHESVPIPERPVSMTFRLPADLPETLLRVSMERRLARRKPWSQQDIVAEAVRQWLERNQK